MIYDWIARQLTSKTPISELTIFMRDWRTDGVKIDGPA